jgi:hypothetical protein
MVFYIIFVIEVIKNLRLILEGILFGVVLVYIVLVLPLIMLAFMRNWKWLDRRNVLIL